MEKSTLFLLMYLLWFGCSTPPVDETAVSSRNGQSFESLVDDGVWCWFSDPRAIYYQNVSEKIYLGSISSTGDVQISSKDLKTKEVRSYTLHENLEVDDHNVPTIMFLPDGRILAFYNEHNGNVYLRKSLLPEDIDQWEEERIISDTDGEYTYTYTNPVRLENENGRIYLFGRKVGPSKTFDQWWQYYKYSDDEGETWSQEIIYLDNEGRVNPPYLKLITDHKGRIDFLFTDGHPKIGADVSVFHMYYENGKFNQTNGELIATASQLPIPIKKVNKIYDAGETNIRGWIWDLALNAEGNPVVTYARFPTENDHRYHYAYWEDNHWVDAEVCRSGGWMPSLQQGDIVREAHYSGGIVIDPNDPRNIYLSRDINGTFEIEHRYLQEDESWRSDLVTDQSLENNVRPYVVNGAPKDHPILLWLYGWYNHYTIYQTQIKMWE